MVLLSFFFQQQTIFGVDTVLAIQLDRYSVFFVYALALFRLNFLCLVYGKMQYVTTACRLSMFSFTLTFFHVKGEPNRKKIVTHDSKVQNGILTRRKNSKKRSTNFSHVSIMGIRFLFSCFFFRLAQMTCHLLQCKCMPRRCMLNRRKKYHHVRESVVDKARDESINFV